MSARDHFLAEFARVAPALPGRGRARLDRARREALDAFAATGLPTQREEEWRYTTLAALDKNAFAVSTRLPEPLSDPVFAQRTHACAFLDEAHLLVFVDGRYEPRLSRPGSLPAGVTLGSLAALLDGPRLPDDVETVLARPADAYASAVMRLNAAFVADGAYIRLAPGTALDRPIQLLSIATQPGAAAHVRHLVHAGEGSRASIVEHYVGADDAAYLTNAATEIAVGRGARIEHHRVQDEGLKAVHVATLAVEQEHGSEFASTAFAFGAALARVDIGVALRAENAGCTLNGLYVVRNRQHVDHHTRIDHAQPHGTSRELYKGVVDGAARAVFDGKVVVHAGARRTDAQQTNRNLLLSESAEVDTKPQLEIYADDVKCSHGATVGRLDEEHLFYLRSRGMDLAAARGLLTYAFAAEIVARVGVAPLRGRLERRLGRALDAEMESMP
jgi:Fe-S cluster assembly protein SufD